MCYTAVGVGPHSTRDSPERVLTTGLSAVKSSALTPDIRLQAPVDLMLGPNAGSACPVSEPQRSGSPPDEVGRHSSTASLYRRNTDRVGAGFSAGRDFMLGSKRGRPGSSAKRAPRLTQPRSPLASVRRIQVTSAESRLPNTERATRPGVEGRAYNGGTRLEGRCALKGECAGIGSSAL